MQNPETLFMGQNLIHLPDVDSTNNFAANMIKQTKVLHGTVILADNQTAGRGQSGNSWQVEPGTNLTLSLILKPKLDLNQQFLISKITCLAIIDTLKILGITAEIKWPNDILVEQRKIAGILIENSIKGSQIETSIVGIGLNVNQVFQGNLNAASIREFTNQVTPLEKVFHLLMSSMEAKYLLLERNKVEEIDDDYLKLLFGLNQKRQFYVDDQQFTGTIQRVNEKGQLEVISEKGENCIFNNQEIKFLFN